MSDFVTPVDSGNGYKIILIEGFEATYVVASDTNNHESNGNFLHKTFPLEVEFTEVPTDTGGTFTRKDTKNELVKDFKDLRDNILQRDQVPPVSGKNVTAILICYTIENQSTNDAEVGIGWLLHHHQKTGVNDITGVEIEEEFVKLQHAKNNLDLINFTPTGNADGHKHLGFTDKYTTFNENSGPRLFSTLSLSNGSPKSIMEEANDGDIVRVFCTAPSFIINNFVETTTAPLSPAKKRGFVNAILR